MMTRFIEVETDAGDSIRVEVATESLPTGVLPAARSDELVIRAQEAFNKAMETIRITASELLNKIQELETLPDKAEVQFGIKIDAEFGAMVAKAGAEAQYLITLSWKNENPQSKK